MTHPISRRTALQRARAIASALTGLLAFAGLGRRTALAAPEQSGPGGMMSGGVMSGGVMSGGMSSGNMMSGHGMMSGSMGDMMAHHNMMGPMKLGMELFDRHAEIQRATQYLPNGIIDATVSANPTTAGIIQAHVIEMYNRMAANQPFNYMMSPSASAMLQNPTRYQRSYRLLPTGIEVTETSDDPAMVKIIYAHARELDRFAAEGMPAMMRGMMGRQM